MDRFLRGVKSYAWPALGVSGLIVVVLWLTLGQDISEPNPMILYMRGVRYAESGYDAAAEALLRRAIGLDPGFAEAHFELGALLSRQEKYEEALVYLYQALDHKPGHVTRYMSHFEIGEILRRQGHLEQALDAYQATVAIHPNFGLPYKHMGAILDSMGRTEESLEAYRSYAQHSPYAPDVAAIKKRF